MAGKLEETRQIVEVNRREAGRRYMHLASLEPDDLSDVGLAAYSQERDSLDKKFTAIESVTTELARIDQERASSKPALNLLGQWYSIMLVLVLFDGLVGESAAVLGSLGFQLGKLVTAQLLTGVSATAILLMLGLMAQAAWLRSGQTSSMRSGLHSSLCC